MPTSTQLTGKGERKRCAGRGAVRLTAAAIRCLGHRHDRPADALDAPTNSPIFGSGITASGPPSPGTLADCIIALSAAERGLARHYRGGPAHRPGYRPGGFTGATGIPRPRR